MSITPSEIKTRYPEFALIADARIQFFIDDAVNYLDETRAGRFYAKLLALLVAHWLALSAENEEGLNRSKGLVSSMSDGDSSIGFGSIAPNNSSEFYFQQSSYGVEFLTYRTYLSAGGLVV